ncbi:hypothetical protein HQN64_23560 [Enterobacteriaceae bacterium BIT-l23]|uniref:hypothetical protein n=1 Tax=Jejubacter sp. L23 TaxID=3092086 RepID=UPI00158470B4|nr:hypothetical protein [Enterobacteriaceae bacterium BIT-l23]
MKASSRYVSVRALVTFSFISVILLLPVVYARATTDTVSVVKAVESCPLYVVSVGHHYSVLRSINYPLQQNDRLMLRDRGLSYQNIYIKDGDKNAGFMGIFEMSDVGLQLAENFQNTHC